MFLVFSAILEEVCAVTEKLQIQTSTIKSERIVKCFDEIRGRFVIKVFEKPTCIRVK